MSNANVSPDLLAAWVDRIHARLLVRYGAAWIRMWDGVDVAMVKADWARELSGMSREAIAYGLDNLPPDRPPTVTQFRTLCSQTLRDDRQAVLPDSSRPQPNLERLKAELARLREEAGKERHPLDWVERLLQRQASGEKMSPAQRDAIRRMANRHEETQFSGPFEAPPKHTLPPGMRGDPA